MSFPDFKMVWEENEKDLVFKKLVGELTLEGVLLAHLRMVFVFTTHMGHVGPSHIFSI